MGHHSDQACDLESRGAFNGAFDAGDGAHPSSQKPVKEAPTEQQEVSNAPLQSNSLIGESGQWGNPIEFLLSCVSLSVGLGNVWRFPFTAFENGGGAFVIPYVIILLAIGKPIYFLEMVLGQFTSRGQVGVWELAPILKGIGYGQSLACMFIVTYYCTLMALTVFYFIASFAAVLPWTQCDMDTWADSLCYSTADNLTGLNLTGRVSSVDQYFTKNVLQKAVANIDDGIGVPEWRLSLCLLFAWLCVYLSLIKGVSSLGKVAYFTAVFPYVVIITLLIRGATLDGAADGMLYFIQPKWEKLATADVWYAAVTQCFFSLSVGFGPVPAFSACNSFRHPIYRDATIVSLLDMFTSLLAGVAIFAILGNLAYETGLPIEQVVQGGTGLAFVSYPDAIGKFNAVPQLFAVLFFLMLFTLGLGSATGMTNCVISVLAETFPRQDRRVVTTGLSCMGFLLGLVYITPGGQYVLDVVDFFSGGFVIFALVVVELIGVCWIYGLNRLLDDIHFMLGIQLGIYWKFTWGFLTPVSLLAIFIYSLFMFRTFRDGDYVYPEALTAAGWVLAALCLIQVPLWGWSVFRQTPGTSVLERLRASFSPSDRWGPVDANIRSSWLDFRKVQRSIGHAIPSWLRRILKYDNHRFDVEINVIESSSFNRHTELVRN